MPIVAVILQRWGHPYLPVQDQAVIDLRVRDVWSFGANTPLTGAYSRYGWDHPGPVMYYFMAVVSGALGGAAWTTIIGNALMQAAAIIWVAVLSWRSAGLRWVLPWMAIVTLSYVATGPWILQQPWNPHAAFPYFVVLLLESWLVAQGRSGRLVGLAVVSSILVETHIGYALLVLLIAGWAVCRLAWAERAAGRSFRSWKLWRPSVITIAVLWFIPVVLDTAIHFPGNTARILKFYSGFDVGQSTPTLGVHAGLGYLATEFRWRPPWLGGPDPLNPLTALAAPSSVAWLAIPVALIGSSWWLARHRGRRQSMLLAELLAVTFLSSVVTLALVKGDPAPYLFYWRIVVGAATFVLALYVLTDALPIGNMRSVKVVFSVILIAVVAITSVEFTRTVAAATGPLSPMEPIAGSILRQINESGQPSGKTIIRFSGSVLGGLHGAVIDQLVREGKPVYVDPALGYQFGYGRTAQPEQVHSIWYVTEQSQGFSILSAQPGAHIIAQSHPLSPQHQSELVRLQRKIASELSAEGRAYDIPALGGSLVPFQLENVPGILPSDLNRLSALNVEVDHGYCLCAVIAFPPDRAPAVASSL
jgi:hypothetical protein